MADIIIIGGGMAGYSAAIYAARAGRRPIVLEGYLWGGLLQETTEVENFPGFPTGILGPELAQRFRDQAERLGASLVGVDADEVLLAPGGHQVRAGGQHYQAPVLILATGAAPRALGVPGEADLVGRGVSSCATCDGPFFAGQDVAVIGGGDSALEEALFLERLARRVTLIHRRDGLRASYAMQQRLEASSIELLSPYTVSAFVSQDDGRLGHLELASVSGSARRELKVAGAFVAIGHQPRSALVRDQLELDADGYVCVAPGSTATSVAGVFAAGDVQDRRYRQAITAAASGVQAALDAEAFLAA